MTLLLTRSTVEAALQIDEALDMLSRGFCDTTNRATTATDPHGPTGPRDRHLPHSRPAAGHPRVHGQGQREVPGIVARTARRRLPPRHQDR